MLNEDSETISTLLKLAQPAATAVLAISILSILFIIKAEYSRGIFIVQFMYITIIQVINFT